MSAAVEVAYPRLVRRNATGRVLSIEAQRVVWRDRFALTCDLCGPLATNAEPTPLRRKGDAHRTNHGPDHWCRVVPLRDDQ